MKTRSSIAALMLILSISWSDALLTAQEQMTGAQIMEKVDTRTVPVDSRMETIMKLIDKRGSVRERTLKSYRWGDDKQIMWFLAPADVKGSSFLKHTYDDRDDDMWLYLPSFGKVRRIASHAKKGSFMGSDFTYEDMGDRKLKDYEYKLMGEEKIDGKECWIVESIPNKGVVTDYSKIVSWVWKTEYMLIKEDFYDRRNQLKKKKVLEPVNVGKYWVAQFMSMENLKSKHKTEIYMNNIEVDTGLEEKLFDTRYMKRIHR